MRERCHTCWNLVCSCEREDDRKACAESYLHCAQHFPGPVNPKDNERAKRWVRLVGLDKHRDPTAFELDPWGSEVVRAAMEETS